MRHALAIIALLAGLAPAFGQEVAQQQGQPSIADKMLADDIGMLAVRNAKVTEQASLLQAQLQNAQQALNNLQKDLDAAKKDLDAARQAAKDAEDTKTLMQRDLDRLTEQVKDLEAKGSKPSSDATPFSGGDR